MSEEGLNLTHHCNSNYSFPELVHFNLGYSITSMLTFILTAAILVSMIFYRAYRTILQRLFIYLTISILVYLVIISLNIQLNPRFFKHTGPIMCKWTGYIGTSAYTCSLLLSFEISVYLLYMMHYQLQEKPLPTPNKHLIISLEVIGVCVAVLLPPALLVIPLEYYGINGAVCWVKVYENTSCHPSSGSLALGKGIFSVYILFTTTNLTTFMVLVCLFCWLSCRSQQSRAHYLSTARRTAVLFVLLVGYTAIHFLAILIPYFTLSRHLPSNKAGALVFCILAPASQFIRPLAYMFFLNSIKKFRWQGTRTAASEWRESWRVCCLKFRYWVTKNEHHNLLINNLDLRSSECITPSLETSSHYYESMGGTPSMGGTTVE